MFVGHKVPMRSSAHAAIAPRAPKAIRLAPVRALDPVQTSYFVGKGITLFTMFYCTMNWWFYKRTREDLEDDKNDMV